LEQCLQGGHDLIISNEMLAEATKVLRYPRFRTLYGLTDADLLSYTQFLQSIAHLVVLDPQYRAPLRDPNDLMVLQTAELGEADILCTDDGDFYDPTILSYCAARGIEVCDELTLLQRLTLFN
jgi:putative PIN family toxin of toxin-antitoxin system